MHVQPGARRPGVAGVHGDALKLAVSAPPVDGKANDAITAMVAALFGVPSRAVTVVAGHTARRKTLALEGLSLATAEARLAAALATKP